MTDSGFHPNAARLRLALLCEIEWLEEMRRAHRGSAESDEAFAVLEVAVEAALRRRRGQFAALAAAGE